MALNIMNVFMALAGVVSHLAYFNRGEHHLYGARYFQIFVACYLTAIGITLEFINKSISRVFTDVSSLAISYLAGVYASLLIYRVSLGPLCKFPGPFGAKFSNLWFSLQLANHDAYKKVVKLHEIYGDFVRIGSNDLSILHPHAVEAIYGPKSKCRKADWYDISLPIVSMHLTRHQSVHDKRRRIWSKAFSDKALRDYQYRIKEYQDRLIAKITKTTSSGDQLVNVAKYFNLYSFDVMGDLAFATSFDMLTSDQEHWAIKLLNEGLQPLGFMFPAWFFRVMVAIPGLMNDWWKFINYCSQMLEQRMTVKTCPFRKVNIVLI